MTVEKRINEIVNRLNKTKTEKFPDLRVEREQRDQEEREDKRKEMQEKVSLLIKKCNRHFYTRRTKFL